MRKMITILFITISISNSLYARHIFTDNEKEKIVRNVVISISSVGKQLAFDEITMKLVNKYLIANTLIEVLSRVDDKVIAKFLSYPEKDLVKKLGEVIGKYQANNTLSFAKKYKVGENFFKINAYDLLFIVTDITVEFIKIEIIHDDAKELLLDLIYNDLKAYVKLETGDPIGATFDWGKANVTALYTSTTGIYKLSKEFKKNVTTTNGTRAFNQGTKLESTYTSFISKAETVDEKKARERGFFSSCIEDDTLKYYLDAFDNKKIINDYCLVIQNRIKNFDKNKIFYLLKRMTAEEGLYSELEFNQFLEKYIPNKDIPKYKNIYLSMTYNKNDYIDIVNPQDISQKYLKRLKGYGYDPRDFLFDDTITFQFNTLMSKADAIRLIFFGRNDFDTNTQAEMNNMLKKESNGKITREKLATYIVNILKLDSLLTVKKRATLKRISTMIKNITYEELVLNKLKIIYRDDNPHEYKWSRIVSKYEFIKILSNSLDNLNCGHSECSYYEIMKRGN